MKLYLLSQEIETGYDTYDSAVVAAFDETSARQMHPYFYHVWAHAPEQVNVRHIGEASPEIEAGVVCASFNAG